MTILIVLAFVILMSLSDFIVKKASGTGPAKTGYGATGVYVYKDGGGSLRTNAKRRKVNYYSNSDGEYEYIYSDSNEVYQSSSLSFRMNEIECARKDRLKTVVRWDEKRKHLEESKRYVSGIGYYDIETQRLFVIRKILGCNFYMDVKTWEVVRRTDGEIKRERKCQRANTPYMNANWKEILEREIPNIPAREQKVPPGLWLTSQEEEEEWRAGNERITSWKGKRKAFEKRQIKCDMLTELAKTSRITNGVFDIPPGYLM